MSWLSRLFKGSELEQARLAAEASGERAETEARNFERWTTALKAEDRATKAAAHGHLRTAASAAERGDGPGWLEARQHFDLARAAYCAGRAAQAASHPREAAVLLLGEASEVAAEIRDLEDRSARAAEVAVLQAHCNDLPGARRTLERVSEPADRASAGRAIAVSRAATEGFDPARLLRELAPSDTDDWDHEEILLAIVEDRCRRGDLDGARAMLSPIEDPDLQAQAWRLLAATEARRGRMDEARAIASRIEHARWSAAAWSDLALAQAASGDLDGARMAAEGIRDEDWRSIAMGGLAGAMAERGNSAGAAELASRIAEPPLRDDALTWIAEARARRGDFEGALATLGGIHDRVVLARELVTIAEAAQGAGKQELAGDLLRRALEGAEELRSSTGNSPAWLAQFLVDARSRLGEFEAAEAVVQVVGEERQRADLLGSLAFHAARHGTGGLMALEELLQRHPGVLERLAILQHGARALFSLDEARTASGGGDPASRS